MGGFRGMGVDAEGRGLGGDGVTLDFDRQLPVPYRRAGRAVVARPSGRPLPHVYLSGARKLRGRRDGAQPQEQLHGSRF
jgi:hypothetical protein